MRTLVLLLLVLGLSLNLLGVQADCSNHGTLEGAYCNCYAGAAPVYSTSASNCDSYYSSDTCSGSADDAITSGNYAPTLDQADVNIANDRLVITFRQPVVKSPWYRRESYVKIYSGNSILGAQGSASCSYPGSMWTKTTLDQNACEDDYTFSKPWANYDTCGFHKVVTWSTMTYTAVLEFSYQEMSGDAIPLNRTLSNLFNFNIQIARQKEIVAAINTHLDAIQDADVSAVIAGTSAYDLHTGRTRVLLQTQTSWPYRLASAYTVQGTWPSVLSSPTGTLVTIAPNDLFLENCPLTANSACIQQFEVIISTSPGSAPVCDYSGNYLFGTQLICNDISTCVATAGPNITVVLDKIDVCEAPSLDNSLTAADRSLVAYGDNTFTNSPTTAFQTGDTAWFSFSVTDPHVSIDTMTLNSITLTLDDNTGSDIIYTVDSFESSALTSTKEVTTGVHAPMSTVSVTFGLALNRVQLPSTIGSLAPGDSIKSMTLEVVVDILYHGNSRKRVSGIADDKKSGVTTFLVRSSEKVSPSVSEKRSSFMGFDASNCTGSRKYACVVVSFVQKALGSLGF